MCGLNVSVTKMLFQVSTEHHISDPPLITMCLCINLACAKYLQQLVYVRGCIPQSVFWKTCHSHGLLEWVSLTITSINAAGSKVAQSNIQSTSKFHPWDTHCPE